MVVVPPVSRHQSYLTPTSSTATTVALPVKAMFSHSLSPAQRSFALVYYYNMRTKFSFQIYSGNVPFPEVAEHQVIRRIIQGSRPERPTLAGAGLMSDDLWTLMTQCWDTEPHDRPRIDDVAHTLAVICKSHDSVQSPPVISATSSLTRSNTQPSISSPVDSAPPPYSRHAASEPEVNIHSMSNEAAQQALDEAWEVGILFLHRCLINQTLSCTLRLSALVKQA